MLFLVGLGLGTEKDITLRGLEAIQSSSLILLESYTSLIGCIDWSESSYSTSLADSRSMKSLDTQSGFVKALERLSAQYGGKSIRIASRWEIESSNENAGFLHVAKKENVALLVVGDPLFATTHTDLLVRCKRASIAYQVIHNASIMNAVGSTGISMYAFGPSISVPFFTENWRPYSFYEKLEKNLVNKEQHTLLLLDIKVKEPTEEELACGRVENPKSWIPPSFMSIRVAIEQLFEAESVIKRGVVSSSTLAVGIARAGHSSQLIASGTLTQLRDYGDAWGAPLHALVIPATSQLHELEWDMIRSFSI
ncbi:hypothetical protein DI09_237p30 [Mitosporidium daphniae]|uniref:diphthine methyl ester synthase n=1 Tax=Mitosporidium daphniae TaxID=1485682 RepID=A0A098VSK0_9MICR|nr:uncharacterized protein DI09_237p30 [Mitosporidium daphniae]KGG51957.1 hypothetical protein DI09_237p30 [Mitosporidium daphniae]|eukprot:XP_013238393.1 uncharacterized protein DI09_237p30 [Mitosporidium daphniae]